MENRVRIGLPTTVKITHTGRRMENTRLRPKRRGRIFFSASACPAAEENKGSARAGYRRVQLKMTVH